METSFCPSACPHSALCTDLELNEGVVEAVSRDRVAHELALHDRPEAAEDELQVLVPGHLSWRRSGDFPA